MSETARIRHELQAIKNYLSAAEDIVKTGHIPDMSGLEHRIARLCESIQTADPETQQSCLPELHVLTEQLNICEKAMRDLHAMRNTEGEKS